MEKTNHIFMLIHGAWHASWCWKKVAKKLEALGHAVITPDLPGHGTSRHQAGVISLSTYVDFVQDIILQQKEKVILVGHSMAGIIISQVAENIPNKIDKLVYVAAFLPEPHGSLMEEARQASSPGVSVATRMDVANNLMVLDKSAGLKELFYNCCTDLEAEMAIAQLQEGEPLILFGEGVNLSQENFGRVPKLYVECLKDNTILIQDQRRMHNKVKIEVVSLDSDHSPFVSRDEELVSALCL
jgi:pimeloyl-ACP methyl ester carboxylesterase